MQGSEAEGAWRLFTFNWLMLGAIGVVLVCGIFVGGFSVTVHSVLIGFGFVAIYAAFAFYNAKAPHRRDPQVVFVLGGMAQIVLLTLIMTPLTYVAASINMPMQDAALLALDRVFGLDWMAYLNFAVERPVLASWLNFGYTMIKWPLFMIPVALAAGHYYCRLQQHTLSFMIALVVTTVISTLVPAIGAFYGFGISIADYPVFNPGAFESALHDIPRVRDGSLRVLDLGAITGIVTFPSFHAASAALYLWALWPVKWLRPVTLFANIAMLAATPLVGGHYFIDIFAGIAVAVVSILAAGKVCRHVLAGSPVRGTAMPQAASSG